MVLVVVVVVVAVAAAVVVACGRGMMVVVQPVLKLMVRLVAVLLLIMVVLVVVVTVVVPMMGGHRDRSLRSESWNGTGVCVYLVCEVLGLVGWLVGWLVGYRWVWMRGRGFKAPFPSRLDVEGRPSSVDVLYPPVAPVHTSVLCVCCEFVVVR